MTGVHTALRTPSGFGASKGPALTYQKGRPWKCVFAELGFNPNPRSARSPLSAPATWRSRLGRRKAEPKLRLGQT